MSYIDNPDLSVRYLGTANLLSDIGLTDEQKKDLADILTGDEKSCIEAVESLLYKNKSKKKELNKKLLKDFYCMLLNIDIRDNGEDDWTSLTGTLFYLLENEILTQKQKILSLQAQGKDATEQEICLQKRNEALERFSLVVEDFVLGSDDD